jgi:hypothetical protein
VVGINVVAGAFVVDVVFVVVVDVVVLVILVEEDVVVILVEEVVVLVVVDVVVAVTFPEQSNLEQTALYNPGSPVFAQQKGATCVQSDDLWQS